MNPLHGSACATIALLATACTAQMSETATATKPTTLVRRIPSGVAQLRMALHQLPEKSDGAPRVAVLFLHGATFPSSNAAGWEIDGVSWMTATQAAGRDVWALDFVGYGASDRYPEMSAPSSSKAPLGNLDEMLRQVERAVDAITGNRADRRIILIAHSAGTFVAGAYSAQHPERVAGLLLFGAPAPDGAPDPTATLPAEPAFDMTPEDQWNSFEPAVREAGHWTRAAAEPWGRAWLASDPTSDERSPTSVRVPYGMVAQFQHMKRTASLPYEPERLSMPVLVAVGEWDQVTPLSQALALFHRLPGAAKRLVVAGQAGHRMHLEETRGILHGETAAFLGQLP